MKSPAFQFYADDFLAGTVGMNNEERGLYITLLCLQWNRGSVTEDDFDRHGKGIATASLSHVKGKFERCEKSGEFRNKRLEIERRKQSEYRKRRASAGVAGAKARWQTHSDSNAIAMASGMAKDGSPSPSPSPSPSTKVQKDASLPLSSFAKDVFTGWNQAADNLKLPKCLLVSDKRRRAIEARQRDPFFVAHWKEALARLAKSEFCKGTNDRGWVATFEWFIKPDSVACIIEGKYDTRTAAHKPNHATRPDRNEGTLNASRVGQYDGVGKVF